MHIFAACTFAFWIGPCISTLSVQICISLVLHLVTATTGDAVRDVRLQRGGSIGAKAKGLLPVGKAAGRTKRKRQVRMLGVALHTC